MKIFQFSDLIFIVFVDKISTSPGHLGIIDPQTLPIGRLLVLLSRSSALSHFVKIFGRTVELALSRPAARHRPAHAGPVPGVSAQQGPDPGGSEQPQESHPQRGRGEARGDVEDVGADPGLQTGPALPGQH